MKNYYEKLRNGESREYCFPNLIRTMKEKGIKVSDLAKALNKDYYQISHKINGAGQFNMRDIKKICSFLGGTFEELFYSPYDEVKELEGEERK